MHFPRPANSNLLRFTLAAVLTFLLVAYFDDDADAIPPSSVHAGQHGVVDHGWVRTLCAVNDDGARCMIRVDDEVSEYRLRLFIDGKMLSDTTAYGEPYLGNWERHRHPAERVTRGVKVRCVQRDSNVTCDLHLAERYEDFNIGTYANDWYMGGVTGRNIEMF